jgi:hypothetical protein
MGQAFGFDLLALTNLTGSFTPFLFGRLTVTH